MSEFLVAEAQEKRWENKLKEMGDAVYESFRKVFYRVVEGGEVVEGFSFEEGITWAALKDRDANLCDMEISSDGENIRGVFSFGEGDQEVKKKFSLQGLCVQEFRSFEEEQEKIRTGRKDFDRELVQGKLYETQRRGDTIRRFIEAGMLGAKEGLHIEGSLNEKGLKVVEVLYKEGKETFILVRYREDGTDPLRGHAEIYLREDALKKYLEFEKEELKNT